MTSSPQQSDQFENIREEMIRGHEIDVVDLFLEDHVHRFREQAFQLNDFTEAFPGNLKILAKGTAKGAAGEENGSGPMSACERGLFSEVGAHVGHPHSTVLPAKPGTGLFTLLQPIHTAFPWAEKTLLE
jgi:hypothetical protein